MSWWSLPRRPRRGAGAGDAGTAAASPAGLRERAVPVRGKLSIICQFVAFAALSYGDGVAGIQEAIKYAVHGLGISCLSRRVIAEQLRAGTTGRDVAVPLRARCARCGVFIIGRSIFLTRCGVF